MSFNQPKCHEKWCSQSAAWRPCVMVFLDNTTLMIQSPVAFYPKHKYCERHKRLVSLNECFNDRDMDFIEQAWATAGSVAKISRYHTRLEWDSV